MGEIPAINKVKKFSTPDYEINYLDNGIPCYILKIDDPDIIKMEIIYDAGRIYEKYRALAKSTASLLKEGTSNMSSSKIAETIDYYGASISTGANMDTSVIQLYALGKYFDNLIPVIHEIVTEAVFPEDEIEKFKRRNIDSLKIELSKNEVLAYRHFTEKIFGKDHPYGYNTTKEDYLNISREKLLDHFHSFFVPDNMKIFLTGKIDKEKLDILNKTFGSIPVGTNDHKNKIIPVANSQTGKFKYENKRIHQTSIRIGKRLFNRTHPDYPGMYFLNTILGGYFGSRLSENIREDKGYTYGIYSTIDMMLKDGYFMISTDVGNEYLDNTLKEIYKEIDLLRTTPVSEEEMQLVKNYIKGNFLSMVNGPLHSINLIKTIQLSKLNNNFFTDFLREIDNIDTKQVMNFAKKYLDPDSFTEVLVGHNINA